jgi:hypothetical protein
MALTAPLLAVLFLGTPPAPAPQAKEEGAPEAQPILIPVAPAALEIHSRGAEPHLRLRPPWQQGDALPIEFTVDALFTRSGERLPRELARPLPVRWVMPARVTAVDAAGKATIVATVSSAEPLPHPSNSAAQVAATTAAIQPLLGTSIELRVGADGGLEALRVPAEVAPRRETTGTKDTDGARPIELLVEGLSMLFRPQPTEPIGRDARWTVRTTRRVDGIERVEVLTSTVSSSEGSRLTLALKATVEPTALRSALPDARFPEGRLVVAAALEGNGAGTTTWEAGRLLPVALRQQLQVVSILEALVPEPEARAGGEKRAFIEEREVVTLRMGADERKKPQ